MLATRKSSQNTNDLVVGAVSGATADRDSLRLYNRLQSELKASVMRQTMIWKTSVCCRRLDNGWPRSAACQGRATASTGFARRSRHTQSARVGGGAGPSDKAAGNGWFRYIWHGRLNYAQRRRRRRQRRWNGRTSSARPHPPARPHPVIEDADADFIAIYLFLDRRRRILASRMKDNSSLLPCTKTVISSLPLRFNALRWSAYSMKKMVMVDFWDF